MSDKANLIDDTTRLQRYTAFDIADYRYQRDVIKFFEHSSYAKIFEGCTDEKQRYVESLMKFAILCVEGCKCKCPCRCRPTDALFRLFNTCSVLPAVRVSSEGNAGSGKTHASINLITTLPGIVPTSIEKHPSETFYNEVGKQNTKWLIEGFRDYNSIFKATPYFFSHYKIREFFKTIKENNSELCSMYTDLYGPGSHKYDEDFYAIGEKTTKLFDKMLDVCTPLYREIYRLVMHQVYYDGFIRYRLIRRNKNDLFYQSVENTPLAMQEVEAVLEITEEDIKQITETYDQTTSGQTRKRKYYNVTEAYPNGGGSGSGERHHTVNGDNKKVPPGVEDALYKLVEYNGYIAGMSPSERLAGLKAIFNMRFRLREIMAESRKVQTAEDYTEYVINASCAEGFTQDRPSMFLLGSVGLFEEDGKTPVYHSNLADVMYVIIGVIFNTAYIHLYPRFEISSGSDTQSLPVGYPISRLDMISASTMASVRMAVLNFIAKYLRRNENYDNDIDLRIRKSITDCIERGHAISENLLPLLHFREGEPGSERDGGHFPYGCRMFTTHDSVLDFNKRVINNGVCDIEICDTYYISSNIAVLEAKTPLNSEDIEDDKELCYDHEEICHSAKRLKRAFTSDEAWHNTAKFFVNKRHIYKGYKVGTSSLVHSPSDIAQRVKDFLGEFNIETFCEDDPKRESNITHLMQEFAQQANEIRQELEDKYKEMQCEHVNEAQGKAESSMAVDNESGCGGSISSSSNSGSTCVTSVEEMVTSLINMRNSEDRNINHDVDDKGIELESESEHNTMEYFLRKIKNNRHRSQGGMFGEMTEDEKFKKNEEFLRTATMTQGGITSEDRKMTAYLLGEDEAALASVTDAPDDDNYNDERRRKSGLKSALKMYIMGPARLFLSIEELKHERRYAKAIHRRLKLKNPSSAGEDSDAKSKNNVCEVERIPHCDLVSVYAALDTELLATAPYKHKEDWYNTDGEKISVEEKEAWYTELIKHIQENTSCIQTHLAFRGKKKFKRGSRVWNSSVNQSEPFNTTARGAEGDIKTITDCESLANQSSEFKVRVKEQILNAVIHSGLQKLNIDPNHDYVSAEQILSKNSSQYLSAEIYAENCDEDVEFEEYDDRIKTYPTETDFTDADMYEDNIKDDNDHLTSNSPPTVPTQKKYNDQHHNKQKPEVASIENMVSNMSTIDLLNEDIADAVEWDSSYHTKGLYSKWVYFSDEAIPLILKAQSVGNEDDEERHNIVKNLLTITLKFGSLMRGLVATLNTYCSVVKNIYFTAITLLKRGENIETVADEAFRRYICYKSLIPTHTMYSNSAKSSNNGKKLRFHSLRNPFEGCQYGETYYTIASEQIDQDIAFMWKNLDDEMNAMLMSMLALSEKIPGMDPLQVYDGYVEHGPLSTCGTFRLKRERFMNLNGNTNSTIILGSYKDHKALDKDVCNATAEMSCVYRGFDKMGAEPYILRRKRGIGKGAGEASEAMKVKHALESFFPMDYNKGKAVIRAGRALVAVMEPRQTSSMTWETFFGEDVIKDKKDKKKDLYIYGTVLRRHMPTINSAGEAAFHGMFRMNKGEHVAIRKDNFFPGHGPEDSGLIFKTSRAVYYHSPKIASKMHKEYGSYTDKKRSRYNWSNSLSSPYDNSTTSNIDVTKGITSSRCPDLRSTLFETSYVISILIPLVSNSANTIHSAQGESIPQDCFLSGKDVAEHSTLFLVAYTRATIASKTHLTDPHSLAVRALWSKMTREERKPMGEKHLKKVTMLRRQHIRQ